MKLNEFVNNLAVQSGLQADNEALKQLLSDSSIDKDIPDEVWNQIDKHQKSLLTLDAAKNNTELKNHFTASALDGVDSWVTKQDGLSEDQRKVIEAERNSYEKLDLLNKFQSENWNKKLTDATDGKIDVTKYQKQIEELNGKIGTTTTEWEQKLKDQEAQHVSSLLDSTIQNHFSNYDYSTQLSRDEYVLLANNKLKSEVTAKGWKVINNGNGLDIKTSDGMEVWENNEKVTFQSLADKATTGYLKANDNSDNTSNNTQTISAGNGKTNATAFELSQLKNMED